MCSEESDYEGTLVICDALGSLLDRFKMDSPLGDFASLGFFSLVKGSYWIHSLGSSSSVKGSCWIPCP